MSSICSNCGREVDPRGEECNEDQHFLCESCYLQVVVSFGAVVVPLLKPVYHKITCSIEEHQWIWLQQNPREKVSWILREAIERRI